MTVTPKALINTKYASLSGANEYQSPATGKGTIIDKFTAKNNDSSSRTLAVYLIPSGGTNNNSTLVTSVTLTAGQEQDFSILQNQILNPSDVIFVQAGAASMVTFRASGREVG